ncbi:ECF transporter S component [candidate division KSB1 bacterium]|nr:ECF transporter S component [candidate division KSB1 bacterium]RQW00163.1 MAG: ECF transporter S component [candidate division KSB1 bacterium]
MTLSTKSTSRLIFLIALTLIFEMLGLPQPVTGPLVNMMLILTTLVISTLAGVSLGFITPVVAAVRGQLPGFLLPMIPFIIVSNALLVILFSFIRRLLATWLRDDNLLLSFPAWLGLFVGAFVKFLVLYHSARILLPMLISKNVPEAFIAMMSLPQLLSAIFGGALALFIFRMLSSRFDKSLQM